VRRLLKILLAIWLWATGAVVVAYSVTYLEFNDEVLGRFISDRVTSVDRGTFTIRSAHFDYLTGLASLLLGTQARAVGEDYELRDPDGNLVLEVPYAETEVNLNELAGSLVRFALTRNFTLDLHFGKAHIPKVVAVIAPTRSSWDEPVREVNLVAAMSSRVKTPPRPKGAPVGGGELRITVEDAQIDDAHFAIGFPDAQGKLAWSTRFTEAAAHASLIYSSRDELTSLKGPYFFFKIRPLKVSQADLRIGDYRFPLEDVDVAEFGPNGDKREDLLFHARAHSLGATASIDGALTDSYSDNPGVKMSLDFQHGAGLLGLLPKPLDTWLGGDPRGQVRFDGPFKRVLVTGDAAGAQANAGGLIVSDLTSSLFYDPDQNQLKLGPAGKSAGGALSAKVEVGLERLAWWRASLSVKGVDPSRIPVLPPELRKPLAGRLDATLRLGVSLAAKDVDTIYVQAIDGELERAPKAGWPGLPRRIRLTGALDWAPTRVQLKDLQASGSGLTVAASGNVDPRDGRLATSVRVESARGASWLADLGARDVKLGEARASGNLSGTVTRPELGAHVAASKLSVQGRPVEHVDADVALRSGVLKLYNVRGHGLGGTFDGDAELGLLSPGRLALRERPTLRAHLHGSGVQLATAVGWDGVDGLADLSLSLDGPLQDPVGQLEVKTPRVTLKGDAYQDGRLHLQLGNGGATIDDLHLQRKSGGSLSGSGRVGWDGELDLHLKPRSFPLSALPGLRELPVALAGLLSGDVAVSGDKDHPLLGGLIALAAFKVRDTLLGDGKLQMIPGTDAIAIKGSLFGKISVDGYLTLFPKFTVVGTFKFVDVELERIFPEIRRLAEVRGRTTGEARITFDGQEGLTYAGLTLDQLTLTLSGTEEDGRPRHLVVHNRDPVKLSYASNVLRIDRAHLTSSLGAFQVQGQVAAKNNDVHLQGQIGLEFLEYFFRGAFDHTHGDAFVDLTVKGDVERPELQGVLDLKHAVLVPHGLEHKLNVPQGRVDFTASQVTLRDLTLLMDDARATASGSIELDRWVPGAIHGEVHGELSLRLLQWMLQDHLADASGRVAVDVKLGGTWQEPRWAGSAEIKRATGKLRRWEHELSIASGTLTFANSDIVLGCPPEQRDAGCRTVRGSIDEHPLNLDGTVTIGGPRHWRALDVRLDGSELRQEMPEYVITFSPHVRLVGSPDKLSARGSIDINDGRYIQNFDFMQNLVLRPRTVERVDPFWVGTPVLETMGLDLDVQSTGPLYIRSNVAELSMTTALHVTGTLSEPRLAGNLQIDEGGRYSIPGFRINFDSQPGTVHFDPEKKIPDGTPTLAVGGEGYFIDDNENSHTIRIRISGTLLSPQVKFESPTDGWDPATILVVLVTGRTPDQVRRAFQGDVNTGRATSGPSASEGVIKTATGWGVGQVLANPLQSLFALDSTIIELGTGSFDVKACKRLGRYVKTCGYGEVGFSAASKVDANLDLRLHDSFGIRGQVEYLNHGIDTSQDSITRGKLELRLQIPLGY
jgi:hypothetical protein